MIYRFSVHSEQFKNKRVLVTGGAKGMGAARVARFRVSGARIATTARSEPVGFIETSGAHGRMPEEVAELATLLAAERAGFVCRVDYVLDGGTIQTA